MTNESIHQQYVGQFGNALIKLFWCSFLELLIHYDVHPSAVVESCQWTKLILDTMFTENKSSWSYICR